MFGSAEKSPEEKYQDLSRRRDELEEAKRILMKDMEIDSHPDDGARLKTIEAQIEELSDDMIRTLGDKKAA